MLLIGCWEYIHNKRYSPGLLVEEEFGEKMASEAEEGYIDSKEEKLGS